MTTDPPGGAEVDGSHKSTGRWLVLVVAISIAAFPLATLVLLGHEVVLSFVDLANLAALVAGAVLLRESRPRRGAWWPDDPAVWVHLGFLVLVAVQVAAPFVGAPMDLEILTGASRFAGPAMLLLGLTWLRRSGDGPGGWHWREALTLLGLLISVGVVLDVVGAVGNPAIEGFYDWKRAIQQPLGVSNILAAYTAFAFWPAASLALEDRRWVPAPVVLLLVTGVIMSRGALLGLVVAGLVVVVGRSRPRLAVSGLVAVTLGLTILPIAADTSPGADGLLSSALRVRDEQFTAAWEAWQDAPVFGVGLNRFQEDVQVRTTQFNEDAVDGVIPYDHPNNAWLMALAETGLVGAALYLALWVLLGLRILQMPGGGQQFAAAGAAAGLAVHAQLEALTYTRGIEVLLALLLAATWSRTRVRPSGGLRGAE